MSKSEGNIPIRAKRECCEAKNVPRSKFLSVKKCPQKQIPISSKRISDILIISSIILFAFFITLITGANGYYALDQDVVFDGAYRLLQGQLPYKDFISPVGPVSFIIQAIFFKLFGISYNSYLYGAAILNSIGAFASIMIYRLLFKNCLRQYKFFSYFVGLMTSVLFYSIFGTPFHDYTAYLIAFITLFLILAAITNNPNRKNYLFFLLAGLCSFLITLTKQNHGLFFQIIPIILLFIYCIKNKTEAFKGLILFIIGFIIGLSIWTTYLYIINGWDIFTKYFLQIPSNRIKSPSIIKYFNLFLLLLFGKEEIKLALLCYYLLLIPNTIIILKKIKHNLIKHYNIVLAIVFSTLLVQYNVALSITTCNEKFIHAGFFGLEFFSLAAFIILSLDFLSLPSKIKLIVNILIIGLSLLCISAGLFLSYYSYIHIFNKTTVFEKIEIDRLKLNWGNPTKGRSNHNITKQNVIDLYKYLQKNNKNFFIFPDFTIMYGLCAKPSPQPVLWFHRGLTYDKDNNTALDRWIVHDLIKNNVNLIVIEGELDESDGTTYNLLDFPELTHFITNGYQKSILIGPFVIYIKK